MLAAAIALLGLKRTAVAGVLLLVLGVVPVLVSSLGTPLGFASLAVVNSAPVIAGVLYLWSAAWRVARYRREARTPGPKVGRGQHGPQTTGQVQRGAMGVTPARVLAQPSTGRGPADLSSPIRPG